ncbi:hypothetical protein M0804_008122 [Polistes exclamans]|nr:hypothetical protein M0804_008122 [Polistes exclamans]
MRDFTPAAFLMHSYLIATSDYVARFSNILKFCERQEVSSSLVNDSVHSLLSVTLAENPFSRFDLQSSDYCPQDVGFLSSRKEIKKKKKKQMKECNDNDDDNDDDDDSDNDDDDDDDNDVEKE